VVRTWLVRPDRELQTESGPIPFVSDEALAGALVQASVMLNRAGGTLAVSVGRERTGVPNEAVTTAAMVTWKDRTDARPAPELPGAEHAWKKGFEAHAAAASEAFVRSPEATVEDLDRELQSEVDAAAAAPGVEQREGHPVSVAADGLEVDESDVPPHLRGV
jgi:hypothetical protein